MFDCFPDFFTNCASVILALMCNLNLHGVFTNITSCMSDQTKVVVVSARTVDRFIWSYPTLGLIRFISLLIIVKKFANFFFLMALLGNFVRNKVTWTSELIVKIHCRCADWVLDWGFNRQHRLQWFPSLQYDSFFPRTSLLHQLLHIWSFIF